MSDTEMRLDPLRETWTIFSRSRLMRPAFAGMGAVTGESPFLAGRENFTPQALHTSPHEGGPWRVRAFPNRLPALTIEGNPIRRGAGFYDKADGVGAHEIIVESAAGEPVESLGLPQIVEVIHAWKARMLDLRKDVRMRSFFIVKDHGAPAGARVAHSVSQLIASAEIAPALRQKLDAARNFFATKKRSIFAEVIQEELSHSDRVVHENGSFVGFCPFAARAPFEIAIYPKSAGADFPSISEEAAMHLADAIKVCLQRLRRALGDSPYHFILTTAPSRTSRTDHWLTIDEDFRWHIEIVPRLEPVNAAELATGYFWNTVFPEDAAEFLRGIKL
jgi:UDPglucose--hexose-1-phosphate uridylyltransferase